MIKEAEWITINRMLLELYGIENEKEFREKLLNMLHILVPYTQGFWVNIDEHNNIDEARSTTDGMEQEVFQEYINYYFKKDYLKFTFDLTHRAMLYRDTDVMDDSIRKKTEIYKNWLLPNNIPYCAGMLLSDGRKVFGILALFRGTELGDFTDRDVYAINVIKEHVFNIAVRLSDKNNGQHEQKNIRLDKLINEYKLTAREKEVLEHFVQGKTNAGIAETLMISESTVKKHIHNIYAKTQTNNRIQLISMLE